MFQSFASFPVDFRGNRNALIPFHSPFQEEQNLINLLIIIQYWAWSLLKKERLKEHIFVEFHTLVSREVWYRFNSFTKTSVKRRANTFVPYFKPYLGESGLVG